MIKTTRMIPSMCDLNDTAYSSHRRVHYLPIIRVYVKMHQPRCFRRTLRHTRILLLVMPRSRSRRVGLPARYRMASSPSSRQLPCPIVWNAIIPILDKTALRLKLVVTSIALPAFGAAVVSASPSLALIIICA